MSEPLNASASALDDSLDDKWMALAIAEATAAAKFGDVPVGAIVVFSDEPIGAAGNMREQLGDPTAHAEILALRRAAERRGDWNLTGATLYVTQEPCVMCAGAAVNSRIARIVYGCESPKAGAVRTLHRLADDPRHNHMCSVTSGVRAEECGRLLTTFFAALRRTT